MNPGPANLIFPSERVLVGVKTTENDVVAFIEFFSLQVLRQLRLPEAMGRGISETIFLRVNGAIPPLTPNPDI